MKVGNVTAKSAANEEYFSVSFDEEARKVLSKIRDENIFAAPVLKGGDFEGIITWRTILQRSASPKTKVRKLLLHPPKIEGDMNLVEVAELMLETGSRAVPVFESEELRGIITQKEIIKAVSKDEGFREKSVENLISEVVTIRRDETIGKAKALMRENRVARLPVVDDKGNLVGSVDLSGIVKTFEIEDAMKVGERKGEAIPERDSPVTAIMNHNPLTMDRNTNLKKVAKGMVQEGVLYTIFVEKDKPIGIITPKDIIELVAAKKGERGAYVQIAGAKNVDSFDRDKILDVGERTVKKGARMFGNVENLIIHLKQQNTEGGKSQYSVRARLFTSYGLFVAKHKWEWSVLEAVERCLNKLERRFRKEHEKKIDEKRG